MRLARWKPFWPALATLAVVVSVFLLLPPFYGLMDDAVFVFLAPEYLAPGGLAKISEFMKIDFEVNGRFRPFLLVLMLGLYGFTQGHPLLLHLINGFLVVGVLALVTHGFSRLWARLYPDGEWPVEEFVPLFFGLVLIYPWTHIGFVLPSMQEKTVFLFGALALWLFTSDKIDEWPLGSRLAVRSLILLLGVFTREQFILFFPLLLAASFVSERRRAIPWQTLGYLLFMFGLVVFIWLVGRNTSYKSKYGLETALQTISRSRSLWIFVGLALLALFRSFSGSGHFREKLPRTCFGLSLLGFVLMMIPWGMGGYLNTIAAPFTVACLLVSIASRPGARFRTFAVRFLPWVGIFLLAIEVGADSLVKNDLERLLRSDELKAAGNTHQIFAPCWEGMDSMNRYAERFFGYTLGAQLPREGKLPAGTSYWLVSRHLGCWPDFFDPDEVLRSGRGQALWQGRTSWSWRLLEVKN